MAAPKTRDYFAEMYIAGLMADAGWEIYFPRRDKGFDFMATRTDDAGTLIRPVQVKGLYPTAEKTDKAVYGYGGRLTQLHPDMVLVQVFFPRGAHVGTPCHIAYIPRSQIRSRSRGGYRCTPATIANGEIKQRRDYARYFNEPGLEALARREWV